MSDRIVVVATTTDPPLAALWHDILTDAGIEAELGGSDTSTAVYPGMPQMAGIDLFVKEEDAVRARELIEETEYEADTGVLEDAAEREAEADGLKAAADDDA